MKKAFVVSKDVGPRIFELEKTGISLQIWPEAVVPTKEQVLSELQKHHPEILIKIGTDNLNLKGDFFDRAVDEGIRIIGTRSTGLNLIDLQRATELNIPVVYCPEVPSVAENIIGMMIGFMRKHPYALGIVKQGTWGLSPLVKSNEVGFCGKTLAIIGVGKIGKSLAVKALGLGFQSILLHDIQPDPVFLETCQSVAGHFHQLSRFVLAAGERLATQIFYVDKNTALREADILSLNIPLTTAKENAYPTEHYLSGAEFSLMRKKPLIINTARGEVIDTKALIEALDQGHIGGAVLDVIEDEPVRPGQVWYDSLIGRDNVHLFPHYSARTNETFDYMAVQVVRGISFLLNGTPKEGRKSIANPEVLKTK